MYSPIRIFWLKEKSAPQRRDCEIVILQVNNHVYSKSPIMGPLPNGLLNGLAMGVILTTYNSWDDPPSIYKMKHLLGCPVGSHY